MAQAQILQPSNVDLAAALLSLDSFSDVAALANSARTLPSQFVLPETTRPLVPHDAFLPDFELPAFDLSALLSCQSTEERSRMTGWLCAVCKEWGFFQLVNHGLHPELLRKMESFGRSFFELPSSIKEKVANFRGKFDPSRSQHGWVEAVNLGSVPETVNSNFINVAWPEGNKKFSDCFEEYTKSMETIARTVTEILMEGMGLEPSVAIQSCFESHASGVRYNYYPPCPQPSLAIGLGAHTDPNVLTLLYQDEVGGLQLRGKDGEWRAVKPRADSFVVNVGDVMKVWTNGALRCAEHRAVLNSGKARLSLGFFVQPERASTVKPLEEQVGAHYKPFNYGEYINFRVTSRSGLEALNLYAGI